mmetsp:Transcript_4567/g.13562  ORF Transcript_4567/g.13562 Transcript_4567/m.13562 type:complete len:391 (+) Transcript_4567:301-1473(+)
MRLVPHALRAGLAGACRLGVRLCHDPGLLGRGLLGLRNAGHGAAVDANGGARDLLGLGARLLGVCNPGLVKLVRALGGAPVPVAAGIHARVPAVEELEEVVLALVIGAAVTDRADRELSILHAILLFATLAERAAVVPNDRAVPKVAVDPIVTGGVGHRDVDVVHPGHGLGGDDLLLLRGVHVALAAHDELGAPHGAVAPDLRVVAVVADDEADLEALGTVADIGLVPGVPAFDGAPRHNLAVFLHDIPLVIDQDERVVRHLLWVFFVALACKAEDSPDLRLLAGRAEHGGLIAGDFRRGGKHLPLVVHDAMCGVLREYDQVESREAGLCSLDKLTYALAVLRHILLGVQAGHPVLEDRHANGIRRGADVAMAHHLFDAASERAGLVGWG